MNTLRLLAFAISLAFLGSAAWAEDVHHPEPEAAVSAAKAPKAAPGKAVTKESIEKMDKQMMDMREMHEKMTGAKTPQERSALIADHMKSMQGGMAMMGGMGRAAKDGMKGGMPSDMATRQQMMEKRMEMMEATMQMMMDQLPLPVLK